MSFPENWTRVRVKGRYILPTGIPAQGHIVFTVHPHGRIVNTADNTIVIPEDIKVVLDEDGGFSAMIPSTNDPDIHPHFRWHIRESFTHNRRFNYYIELPWDIAELDLSHAVEYGPEENLFAFVRRSGDSMTGYLTLYADPEEDLHPATKVYVDTLVSEVRDEIPTITHQTSVYPFYQPSSNWLINHNLNRYPQVSILDSNDEEVESDVIHNSINSVTIIFQQPIMGKAVLT